MREEVARRPLAARPTTAGPPRARGGAGLLVVAALLLTGCASADSADRPTSSVSRPTAPTSTSSADRSSTDPSSSTSRRSTPPSRPSSTTGRSTATDDATPATAGRAKGAGAWHDVVGITDGDTIKVSVGGQTERVRVIGIDTPELRGSECFAQQASSKMQSLAQSRRVQLEADPSQDERDRYGRLLRHVRLEDGRLAAEVLISGGYGREYTYDRAYAHQGAYRAAEQQAKGAARGLWSSCPGGTSAPSPSAAAPSAADPSAAPAPAAPAAPEAPSAPAAPPAAPAAPSAGGCVIKGNVSSSGERIFHVPGGGSYADTKISPEKGERMFCSEADAVAAGWRKARN